MLIFFVAFLSTCIVVSLLWGYYIISAISSNTLSQSADFFIALMGLFLPLVIISLAVAFIYTILEIKKMQILLKDWIKTLHLQQQEEAKRIKILNISPDTPLSKYKDIVLPDDIDAKFETK